MIYLKLATSLLAAVALLAGGALLVAIRAAEREAAAEHTFPPLGVPLRVEGLKIHAYLAGSGPDLVLIHGAGGNLREFTFDLAAMLAKHYRVIAFDRPGLGYSDSPGEPANDPREQARLLQAAAAQLNVHNPIVLGHSYGGAVAMAWALAAPDSTRALVVVSGATMPFPGEVDLWYHLTGGRFCAIINPLLAAFAPQGRIDASVTGIFAPEAVPSGYAAYIGPGLTLRRASLRSNGRQVLALKAFLPEMAAGYPTLTLPVEIVHGTADTTVRVEIHAKPLQNALPNAKLTLIDGAGHMPHHTHPDQIIAAIDRAASR